MLPETIMVTGGLGYIGKHLVLELLDAGRKVLVVDDLSVSRDALLPKGAVFSQHDMGNAVVMQALMEEHNVKTVIHLGGFVVVPESVDDPLKYYENNLGKSITLLRACKRAGVKRFIFSSTAAVYGELADENPVSEKTPLKPVSPYGSSKAFFEQVLKDSEEAYDLTFVILRYFNVAGADPKMRAGFDMTKPPTHLIRRAVFAALGKLKDFTIFGTDYPTHDGTCVRDYIHVSDLAAAHVKALEHLEAGGASLTLNCGYGRGYSVQEVVDMVKAVSHNEFLVIYGKRRQGDPAMVVANAALLREVLEWAPRYPTLALIIEHEIQWAARKHRWAA